MPRNRGRLARNLRRGGPCRGTKPVLWYNKSVWSALERPPLLRFWMVLPVRVLWMEGAG
jgi:hypothetical protein